MVSLQIRTPMVARLWACIVSWYAAVDLVAKCTQSITSVHCIVSWHAAVDHVAKCHMQSINSMQ